MSSGVSHSSENIVILPKKADKYSICACRAPLRNPWRRAIGLGLESEIIFRTL